MDTLEDARFLSTEGNVIFSEQKGRPDVFDDTLYLEIDSAPGRKYLIRGVNRIDVGERVKIYREKNSVGKSCNGLVVAAYEILDGDGDVIHRRLTEH